MFRSFYSDWRVRLSYVNYFANFLFDVDSFFLLLKRHSVKYINNMSLLNIETFVVVDLHSAVSASLKYIQVSASDKPIIR